MPLKVAVIGAGAAGLGALRRLSEDPDTFTPVAFEQSSRLGGNWVYTDIPSSTDNGFVIHSSVYKNLRTNLAKESMFYPDFPFPTNLPSYVMHWDMLKYLDDFAHFYDVVKYIKFCRQVVLVLPFQSETGATQWRVEVRDVTNSKAPNEVYTFDSVFICNGHFSVPRIPEVPGFDTFEGLVQHSHYYREPEHFKGQRVAVFGGGNSGADIALDISSQATKVFWCHTNAPYDAILPDNLEQTKNVTQVKPKSVIIDKVREENVDSIVLCTGYLYQFPFLHPSCHVVIEKGRVKPIYKHIIHTEFPSLFFIGLCTRHCSFPQYDAQIRFAAAALKGTMKLPSREAMDKDADADLADRLKQGLAHIKPHELAWTQWNYHNDLARLANFQPWPAARQTLCDESILHWNTDIMGFRKVNYEVTDESNGQGFIIKNRDK